LYSQAFDSLTEGNHDDIVGLLAYALYKKSIREKALVGDYIPPSTARKLQPTEVQAYRGAAERKLDELGQKYVEAFTPEILQDATLNEISSVKRHIDDKTNWFISFLVNVGAWVFSLLLTMIIINSWNLPNPLQVFGLVAAPSQPEKPSAKPSTDR